MDLCQKQKIFSQQSAASVKFTFSFQHLEKKPEPHDAFFPEIIDWEKCGT